MKKRAKLITGLALAGLLTVGGTFAYLQYQTGTKENTFTFGENVKGDIEEPKWDGLCAVEDETCTNVNPGDPEYPDLGQEQAKKFYPGQVIAKNPTLMNTGDSENGVDAYVAVTIAYQGKDDDQAVDRWEALNKFATIDWNESDWTFNSDYTRAVYKKALKPGDRTTPVFNAVTIKTEATYPETAKAGEEFVPRDTDMHNFQIDVQGYFAQTSGMGDDPVAAMEKVFENTFKLQAAN